jgi:putative colanic acid biosynthesis UDP-glucose lipid carrier transferase
MTVALIGSTDRERAHKTTRSATTATSDQPHRKRWSRQVAADVVGLGDVAAIVFGAIIPTAFYVATDGPSDAFITVVRVALLASIIVYMCLRNWGMYPVNAMHDFPIRPGALFAALLIAMVAVLGVGLPFHISGDLEAWAWTSTWVTASFVLLLANRMLANVVLSRQKMAGRFRQRVAVYGAGEIARRVHQYLGSNDLGISLVGIFDDRKAKDRLDDQAIAISGGLDDLLSAGRKDDIDQIIIALPQAADKRTTDIARRLEQLPVSLHVVTHIASDLIVEGPAHKVSGLGPIGLLDVKAKPLSDWAPIHKRVEDVGLGFVFLLASLPLMVIIALLIKLESNGPVFFRQRRRGHNQKVIEVIKFRTMTVMENGNHVSQAVPNDPRVTGVGWWLRRTSLDELPQLINVLKGEMSIVGPRPHALAHDEAWENMLAHYINRHQVKPGITGLAQVRGLRGLAGDDNTIHERVRNDLEYIAHWSLWLDLKIIARTVCAILTGRNAH